ncbi:caspase family protein [Actinokineospora soli]|uniref:Caspase family protein n=1 Tax=Actinokineospora soli TaxID=1048753 RepID=A0ABW2TQ61_9PSEU
MSARPVDPRRSRIVVVGTPFYRDADLPDRPEVAENVVSLIDVFTDPGLGGFTPEHCVAAPEGTGTAEIGELLGRAAEEAKDLLLFYYSGHGLLGPRRRELYLSLAGTVRARPAFTALPYDAVRDAFLGSGARNRVVIIDSCFSGRAIGVTLGDDDVLGQLEVDGTYTLTSAPPNATALTLPGERHTAFTERLLALFRNGSADAGDMITLGTIYRHLHRRALAEGLPAPQQRGTATADLLGLVRNVRRAPVEAELPPELRHGVDSPFPRLRLAAVTELGDWLSNFDPNRAAAALPVLQRLTADDDPDVAGAAHELLDRLPTERATTGQDGSLAARAELLLHKAEWTAVRIPRGGDHAAVLDEIAAATARCDPDRAERIAAAIPQDLTRALVLGKIAKQVHAHDPARANRLFDAAESALLRLSTDYWTGDAQARLAALTGSVDLDRGLRVAAAIADDSHRFRGMVDLLREVPPTDHQRFDALVRRAEQIIAANRFLPG